MTDRIKVPAEAVRTREQVLDGATIVGGYVWEPCLNCGGTGNYPSSMTPAGRCRFYCWDRRTPETFGKLPTDIDAYVRRAQKSDRAAYRAKARAEQAERERQARIAGPLPAPIAAVRDAFGLDLANLPEAPANRFDALVVSLVGQWIAKGDLSEKQWALISVLPERAQARLQQRELESEARTVSQHVGTPGERLERRLEVAWVSDYYAPQRWGWSGYYIVRLRDDEGNLFTWFCSGTAPDQGGRGVARFTVKKHETYKGEAVTVVSRLAWRS